MKRKEVTREEIIELYINQGLTSNECQKRLGICRKVLYDYFKEYQIERTAKQKFEARSKWTKIYDDEDLKIQIKELFINQQKTKEECRKILNISSGKFSQIVRKLGYKRPKELIVENMKRTCIEKYGVAYNCELNHVKSQQHNSKIEDEAYLLLINKFTEEDVLRQYKTEEYPFPCDFYIKSLDLYIEFNPGPRHNGRAFDKNKEEDIKELEFLNKKAKEVSDWYEGIIRTWSIRDPLKRETAKKNNLNWKEFFKLKELEDWLKTI